MVSMSELMIDPSLRPIPLQPSSPAWLLPAEINPRPQFLVAPGSRPRSCFLESNTLGSQRLPPRSIPAPPAPAAGAAPLIQCRFGFRFPCSRFFPSAQSRVGRCSGASSCFNTYFAFVNRSERLLDPGLALGRKRLQFHASKPPRLPQSQTVFIPAKLNLLRQVWSDVFLRILSVCEAVWHVVVSCRHGKFSSVTRKL